MAHNPGRHDRFSTKWYHRKPKYWFRKDREREDGHRTVPEVVRFDVEPGYEPNGKPPVRIFLGTEPLQARAERVFVWSVKQFRDPRRVYEIHFMKDLAGFRREGWKTGFTNYRFAIPGLAGEHGRAIYNDVDQIYLADPGEMFDLDMKGAGALAVTIGEDSVMLIDCDVMSRVWPIGEVKSPGNVKKRSRNRVTEMNLWGELPAVWNARDDEFEAGLSKCFHFTTLQTQPWRPFPDQLNYKDHKDGDVWHALERSADAARFTSFTRARPSSGFADAIKRAGNGAPAQADDARYVSEVARLARETGASTLLDVSAGGTRVWQGVRVTKPAGAPFAAAIEGRHDGVASVDALSLLPEDDVAWALDELFAAAERFVYVAVTIDGTREPHSVARLPEDWWLRQIELSANRNPGRRWALLTVDKGGGRAHLQESERQIAQAA